MPNDPLRIVWNATNPVPRLALRPSPRMEKRSLPAPSVATGPPDEPFDFSDALHNLCVDIAAKCPALAHVDANALLFTIIKARNGHTHGLQARVTPLRCEGGGTRTVRRRKQYEVQQYHAHGRDLLYLVTFCLPRFQNRTFAQKLVTVFHELYHLSDACDGTLRTFEGRYATHTHNQKEYDAYMAELAAAYLPLAAPQALAFLQLSFWQLCRRHGCIVGYHVPRPKLLLVESLQKGSTR